MTYADTDPTRINVADVETPAPEELTWGEMYKKYYSMLVHEARGKYNMYDPENIVQEVFIKAYNHFGEHDTFRKGWLFQALRTTVIDQMRKTNRRPEEYLASDMHIYGNHSDQSAAAEFDSVEFDLTMEHVKRVVSPKRYAMIALRMDGYTLNEIGEILETRTGTVKSGLHREGINLTDDQELCDALGK